MERPSEPQYSIVDTPSALEELAERMGRETCIAVDMEADSMFHYKEKICLLQIGVQGRTYIVDPLALPDLSPVAPAFERPDIRKIFHGADYDVRSLYRDFRIRINNLFDTELACRFLGFKETGLNTVLSEIFDVTLDKRFQKKDWSVRPLPPQMIEYAAKDVAFLVPLADRLARDLEEKGRLFWVKEECDLLSRVRPAEENDDPLFLRFKGAGRLPRRNLAVLESLLHLRRRISERKDQPLFKVFSNASLKKLAMVVPLDIKALAAAGALSKKQISMHGEAVVRAIREAREIPDKDLPIYPRKRAPRVSPRTPIRIQALREWRDGVAETLCLDPAMLFSKALLQVIAASNPEDRQALCGIEELKNWQKDTFGDSIVKVLDGVRPDKTRRKRRKGGN